LRIQSDINTARWMYPVTLKTDKRQAGTDCLRKKFIPRMIASNPRQKNRRLPQTTKVSRHVERGASRPSARWQLIKKNFAYN